MRRPILTNGLPRNLLVADGPVTILDAEDLNENMVYALTLYVWWFQPGAGPFTNPNLLMATTVEGTTLSIGTVSQATFDDIWDQPAATDRLAPLKVLDRYMIRGEQSVQVANDAAGSDSCFIWGYFEQVGRQDLSRPFRGLQPTALADPFVYSPTTLVLVAAGVQSGVVHQLSPTYVDLLTLDVVIRTSDGLAPNEAGPTLSLPGPVTVPLPSQNDGFPIRMFDGIPMRAPSAADVNLTLNIVTVGAGSLLGIAYGDFDRR